LGIGLGLNASTVAIFAAESAPVYIRGGLAVSWQMFTAFGIFLGFVANVAFYDYGPAIVWRLQLGAPIIPTMPLLMLVYLCPEAPAWHIKRGRYDLAFSSLVQLRNTKLQAAYELYSDYRIRRKNAKFSSSGERYQILHRHSTLTDSAIGFIEPSTFLTKLKALFTVARNRHAVYASYTVMISQQLCGINIIGNISSRGTKFTHY
jgi:hypothetical protein